MSREATVGELTEHCTRASTAQMRWGVLEAAGSRTASGLLAPKGLTPLSKRPNGDMAYWWSCGRGRLAFPNSNWPHSTASVPVHVLPLKATPAGPVRRKGHEDVHFWDLFCAVRGAGLPSACRALHIGKHGGWL